MIRRNRSNSGRTWPCTPPARFYGARRTLGAQVGAQHQQRWPSNNKKHTHETCTSAPDSREQRRRAHISRDDDNNIRCFSGQIPRLVAEYGVCLYIVSSVCAAARTLFRHTQKQTHVQYIDVIYVEAMCAEPLRQNCRRRRRALSCGCAFDLILYAVNVRIDQNDQSHRTKRPQDFTRARNREYNGTNGTHDDCSIRLPRVLRMRVVVVTFNNAQASKHTTSHIRAKHSAASRSVCDNVHIYI